jgi:hypothetical protein
MTATAEVASAAKAAGVRSATVLRQCERSVQAHRRQQTNHSY